MGALIHNKAGCSFEWLYTETISMKHLHQCIWLKSKSFIWTSQHFCLVVWEAISLSEQANESSICWFTSERTNHYSYLCFGHSCSTSPFIPLHSIKQLVKEQLTWNTSGLTPFSREQSEIMTHFKQMTHQALKFDKRAYTC